MEDPNHTGPRAVCAWNLHDVDALLARLRQAGDPEFSRADVRLRGKLELMRAAMLASAAENVPALVFQGADECGEFCDD